MPADCEPTALPSELHPLSKSMRHQNHLLMFCESKRSWSSGYDRRLPSDGPGFNSRRAHVFFCQKKKKKKHCGIGSQPKTVRGPGIEPGSTAWKAAMLTITPATLTHSSSRRVLQDAWTWTTATHDPKSVFWVMTERAGFQRCAKMGGNPHLMVTRNWVAICRTVDFLFPTPFSRDCEPKFTNISEDGVRTLGGLWTKTCARIDPKTVFFGDDSEKPQTATRAGSHTH